MDLQVGGVWGCCRCVAAPSWQPACLVSCDLRELWHMGLQARTARWLCRGRVAAGWVARRRWARAACVSADPTTAARRARRSAPPQGAPYGYTPFCDNNREMEGFRFWKQVGGKLPFWEQVVQKEED